VVSLLSRLTDSAEKLHEPDLVAFTRELTIELFAVASGSYPAHGARRNDALKPGSVIRRNNSISIF